MTLISLTVVVQKNLARAKRLIQANSNIHINGNPALWHVTPDRYLNGDHGGSVSVIRRDLLLLVAVRGVPTPKPTAVQTLSVVLGEV
jgi:hypothetical protein